MSGTKKASFRRSLPLEPATREKISAQGFNIATSTPDEAARFIRPEHEKWGKLVKLSGARLD